MTAIKSLQDALMPAEAGGLAYIFIADAVFASDPAASVVVNSFGGQA